MLEARLYEGHIIITDMFEYYADTERFAGHVCRHGEQAPSTITNAVSIPSTTSYAL